MTPPQGMHTITFAARREKGPVRAENQDQISHFESSVFGQVFLIADGMGGHEGGAIAANMAITGFKQHFLQVSQRLSLRDSLTEAARLTNLDIYEKSGESGGGAARMGSTLVLCVLAGNVYTLANAGDSRCYSFRNGVLTQLTNDHTAVQKMVDSGILSPEEARNHPDASVLTRAFGQRPEIELDVYPPRSLAEDEALLLCSDGLYAFVEESAIIDRLQRNPDPAAAAEALLQLALDAGGHDNISIYVIRATASAVKTGTEPDLPSDAVAMPAPAPPLTPTKDSAPAPVPQNTKPAKRPLRLALSLLAVAAFIAAGPVTLYLHPELAPAGLREKLTAWGIPLPATAAGGGSLAGNQANNQADHNSGFEGGGSTGLPAAAPPATAPPATAPPATAPPTAGSPAAVPPAAESVPSAHGVTGPSVSSAGASGSVSAGEKGKEAAAPTPAVAAASRNPHEPVRIALAHPPSADPAFLRVIAEVKDKMQAAGYVVLPLEKAVRPKAVWGMVTADPATFAPPRQFIAAVSIPQRQKDAVRICAMVGCTTDPHDVAASDRDMFDRNFAGIAVAVFVHPAVRAEEKPAAPADSPAGRGSTKE